MDTTLKYLLIFLLNLEKELIFKKVRENLERSGSFFENLHRSGKNIIIFNIIINYYFEMPCFIYFSQYMFCFL